MLCFCRHKANSGALFILLIAVYFFWTPTTHALDKQLQSLINLTQAQPNDANAYFNLGVYYFQNSQFSEALAPLSKTVELNPQDDEAHVVLGAVYLQVGKNDRAEKEFKQALKINPKNIDAQNNLSLVYFTQERYNDAVTNYQLSLKIDPNNIPALNNLANVYVKLNKADEAVDLYKRVIKLRPDDAQLYDRLAQLYFDNNRYDDVIRMYDHSKGEIPDNDKMFTNLGFAYLYKNDLKDANRYLQKGLGLNPGNPENYYGLGLIAYRQANLDLAVHQFKEALKIKKTHEPSLFQLAITYEDKGDYSHALYYYKKLYRINPKNYRVLKNYKAVKAKAIDYFLRKGSKAYFNNEYPEAVKNWKIVLKLDVKNKNAQKFIRTANLKLSNMIKEHNDLADSYYRQGRHQDAYREWRGVLVMDPKNAQAQQGIKKVRLKQNEKDEIITAGAMAKFKSGDLNTALKELKEQLKNSPKNAMAENYVSRIQTQKKKGTEENYRTGVQLLSKGKYREAIKFLESAAEADAKDQSIKNLLYKARTQLRENIKALLARGDELANAGRVAESKGKYTEVLKLDPNNNEASEKIAALTGKVATVTVSKEEIKKLYYDGVSLYLDGQNKKAIEVWQKILVLDPNNQEAKSSITKAEMELKEMEKRGIKAD